MFSIVRNIPVGAFNVGDTVGNWMNESVNVWIMSLATFHYCVGEEEFENGIFVAARKTLTVFDCVGFIL